MTDNRQKQAMNIFLRATEVEGSQRTQLIQDECGTDTELRKEVESLLRHHTTKTLLAEELPTITAARSSKFPNREKRKTIMRQASAGLKRRQLALISVGIMVLVVIGTATWAFTRVRDSLRQSVRRQLETVLDAEIEALELWIDLQQADVAAWANDPEIRGLINQLDEAHRSNDQARTAQLNEQLMSLLVTVTNDDAFQGIAVVNRDGDFIGGSSQWTGAKINSAGEPYLNKLNNGKGFFAIPSLKRRFVVGIPSPVHNPSVALGAPVFRAENDDEVVGGLCFGFDADEEFARIFSVADFDNSGDTYAFASDALVISNISNTTNQRWVRELGLIDQDGQTALSFYIRDPGGNLTEGYVARVSAEQRPTRIVEFAVNNLENRTVTNVKGYRNYLGIEVVGAARWIDQLGLGVATEMSLQSAFEPLRYVTSAFLFLIISVVALAIGLMASALSLIRLNNRVGKAERLGAYELQELIGQGGMGRVYKATHAFLKRIAAIKLLDEMQTDTEHIARFEREVQLTCTLTHPNTIQIYDYGRTDSNVFYYAMEYLPGITLEQLIIVSGNIGPARTVHLLSQVCSSLREAHYLGLIHRDIKPANLMLCNRGGIADFVKVLDFGIAKQISSEQELTHDNSIVGTPHYIAPERISGDLVVDARSDLYSVGCVAFFLLTGKTPFDASKPVQLFYQLLNEQAPRASTRTEQPIPTALDDLIDRCLQQDPDQRPQNAEEMLEILDALANEYPWSQADAIGWQEEFASELSDQMDESSSA